MSYNTLKESLKSKNINEDVDYIKENDTNDKDTRVYTLVEDNDENYLIDISY